MVQNLIKKVEGIIKECVFIGIKSFQVHIHDILFLDMKDFFFLFEIIIS